MTEGDLVRTPRCWPCRRIPAPWEALRPSSFICLFVLGTRRLVGPDLKGLPPPAASEAAAGMLPAAGLIQL